MDDTLELTEQTGASNGCFRPKAAVQANKEN